MTSRLVLARDCGGRASKMGPSDSSVITHKMLPGVSGYHFRLHLGTGVTDVSAISWKLSFVQPSRFLTLLLAKSYSDFFYLYLEPDPRATVHLVQSETPPDRYSNSYTSF
jgi:hypothetical protein